MSHFDFPILDGICPSWADIAVRATPLGGTLIEMGDIQSINTGSAVEVGLQMEGGRPIKRTTGTVSYDSVWTLYSSGYLKLIRGLLPQAPRRGNQALISLVAFTVDIQWTPPGSTEIFQKVVKGCRVLGDKEDSGEGNDAAVIEMALSPLEIVRVVDGVEILLV